MSESHFLVFNNNNQFSINEMKEFCNDFEVVIYNVSNTVENTKYNHTFIYPEYKLTEADPIKDDKNKKNLGKFLSKKIKLPVLYCEETSIAEIFSIWDKGIISTKAFIGGESSKHWEQVDLMDIIDWLEKSEGHEIKLEDIKKIEDIKERYKLNKNLNRNQVLKKISLHLEKISNELDEERKENEKNRINTSHLKKIFPYINCKTEKKIGIYDISKITKLSNKFFSEFEKIIEQIYKTEFIPENTEFTHNLNEERIKKIKYL